MSLAPTAELLIELGSAVPGSGYDQVQVAGQLSLGGTLKVSIIDLGSGEFLPLAGQSFDVLDWGSLVGTFDNINLPELDGDLTWDYSALYTTGVLSIAAPGIAGDYNNDVIVNTADYVMWRDRLGSQTGLPNDATPGVDAGDYVVWKANFGAGSGDASPSSAAVPEPATIALGIVSAILFAFRQTKRAWMADSTQALQCSAT